MCAARFAIAALAVVACAWFVIGVIQSDNQSRATALINGGGTPTHAQTSQIEHWLDRAGTLNPDRNIDLLRAQAEVRADQSARALVLMKRVVRAEPSNADAWVVFGFAAQSQSPALARLAHAEVLKLAPPVPRAP
jgi:predicted Zn-dependent protease